VRLKKIVYESLDGAKRILDIKKMYNWYTSFERKVYKNEEEAKNDIIRVVEHYNNQFADFFGFEDPSDVLFQYNFIETEKGIKIVPKSKEPEPEKDTFDWDDVEIIYTSRQELHTIANSSFYDYEIDMTPSLVVIDDYIDSFDYYDHKERIENLAAEINRTKTFEPIVVEPNDKWVIEGQHRIRAIKLLGADKVLAYKIKEIS
jgi:hypothetical protein